MSMEQISLLGAGAELSLLGTINSPVRMTSVRTHSYYYSCTTITYYCYYHCYCYDHYYCYFHC